MSQYFIDGPALNSREEVLRLSFDPQLSVGIPDRLRPVQPIPIYYVKYFLKRSVRQDYETD